MANLRLFLPFKTTASLSGQTLAAAILIYPIFGLLAPKGLTVLVIATLFLLLIDQKNWKGVLAAYSWPFMALVAGLAVWSLVTVVWSPRPLTSLNLWLRCAGLTVVGLLLFDAARRLTADEKNQLGQSSAIAGILFTVIFGTEVFTDSSVSRFLIEVWNYLTPWKSARPLAEALLYQPSAVLAVFAWPCAIAIYRRGSAKWAALFLALVGLAMFTQAMLSSFVGYLCGLVGLAIVYKGPRHGAIVVLSIFLLANAILFAISPEIVGLLKQDALTIEIPRNWQHRLYILDFVLGKVGENPLFGWGFDASRSLGQDVVAPLTGDEAIPLHPHNVWAQLWLELGLVGLLGFLALIFWVFRRIEDLSGDRFCAAGAVAACITYLVIGNFSYGVWQNWWLSVAWLNAGFLAALIPWQERGKSLVG